MTYSDPELASSRQHARVQRPRDAATLILVRFDGPVPRILMGQRHGAHAFMPNKYVFPGGRLDPADVRVRPARDLQAAVLAKLMLRMRQRTSAARARGLAVAAVRETYEEAGLLLGRRTPGDSPDLSPLVYFARAITPPGRTRRFDSRFFVADAAHVANLDVPPQDASGELMAVSWFTLDQARALDLPGITRDVLDRLAPFLSARRLPGPDHPVTFQHYRGRTWLEEVI